MLPFKRHPNVYPLAPPSCLKSVSQDPSGFNKHQILDNNYVRWWTKRHKLSWYIKVNFACLCKWSYCISHSQYFPRWLWMEKPSSSSRMLPFLRLSGWERQRLDPGPGAPRPLLLQLAIWSNPSLLGRTHEPRMGLKGYQGRRYWRGHSKKARHCRASE